MKTNLEISQERILQAKENEIIDISDVCIKIHLIEFYKTDKGFISERIFSDGRSFKTSDFHSGKYFKTLAGVKRAMIKDLNLYFNPDGSPEKIFSNKVTVISLEEYYNK